MLCCIDSGLISLCIGCDRLGRIQCFLHRRPAFGGIRRFIQCLCSFDRRIQRFLICVLLLIGERDVLQPVSSGFLIIIEQIDLADRCRRLRCRAEREILRDLLLCAIRKRDIYAVSLPFQIDAGPDRILRICGMPHIAAHEAGSIVHAEISIIEHPDHDRHLRIRMIIRTSCADADDGVGLICRQRRHRIKADRRALARRWTDLTACRYRAGCAGLNTDQRVIRRTQPFLARDMLDPIAPFCLIVIEQIDLTDIIRLLRRRTESKILRDLHRFSLRRRHLHAVCLYSAIDPHVEMIAFIRRKRQVALHISAAVICAEISVIEHPDDDRHLSVCAICGIR